MRKFILSLAVATSALAVAAPAAAQWAPPPPPGYGYGYNHNYGQVRRLQAQIDQLQRHIVNLDRRDIITNREARSLRWQSVQLERQLRYAARNGFNRAERNAIQRRIAQLEWRVRAEARDGNRYGYNDGRGHGDYDRDHNRWHNNNEPRRDGHWDEDRDGRDWDGDGRDRDD